MSISTYNKKRKFNDTPEPSGKKKATAGSALLFVVQKHDASRLHYDFRLEAGGVLKSWAIPKGPSMNPEEKRLAIAVEDHPYDYKDFEGVIPKGNYGAGKVIVWDNGNYMPESDASTLKEREKEILKGVKAGKLDIVLNGEKLKGAFALIKTKGREENAWLLIKKNDEYARKTDVLKKDKSVISGKSLKTVEDSASASKNKPVSQNKASPKKKAVKKTAPKKKTSKTTLTTFLDPAKKQQTKNVGGTELKFTNPSKIYWPKEKISKGDVIGYYHRMARWILPHLKGRPHSLNRHPDGITGGNFYHKNMTGKIPSWMETFAYKGSTAKVKTKYFVCNDEADLLYMANLGCIEINPWHSRAASADQPDWCLIDLDPDNNPFEQVIEVANLVKQVLDSIKVKSFVKTSGSTGIHISIPLGAKYDYDQSRLFAELIVGMVHREVPKFTSLERSPAKRKGKIYLDYLQNRPSQTVAAPFSLRPKPGATVSMPLDWSEVKKGLSIQDFDIYNAEDRVKETGDLFKGVLGKGVDLEKALGKLERMQDGSRP